ncbi:MAG: phosphatase PAP2 family protein [Candidatus Xenobia bacterium]
MKVRSWLLIPLVASLLASTAIADEVVPRQQIPLVKPSPVATPSVTPSPVVAATPVQPLTQSPQQPLPAFVALPAPHAVVSAPQPAAPVVAAPQPVTPTAAAHPPSNPLAVSVPSPGLAAAPKPPPPADKAPEVVTDGLILAGLMAEDINIHRSVATSNSSVALGFTWFGNGMNDMAIGEVMHLTGDERQREAGAVAIRAVLDAGVNVQILKTLFGRENPDFGTGTGQFIGPTLKAGHDTFPSGHTATAFAMATALANYYPEQKVPLYLGASAVGISTVYRHFHWPSDVFAGALLGIASGKQAVRHTPNFLDLKF